MNAGMGFIPVAHELTGALGPSARDELFVPALAVLKKNKLGAAARAALAGEGGEEPAPWNARSVRANALQQFGLAVARGVGLAATHSRRATRGSSSGELLTPVTANTPTPSAQGGTVYKSSDTG